MKVKYLEGLRGFAAFIVVVFHFLGTFYPASVYGTTNKIFTTNSVELIFVSTPLNVMYNGNFAVCIFFVLSGFVLSIKFFQTKDVSVITESAIKRYFRLVVPVVTSVILFFICFSIFEKTEISIIDALYEGLFSSFFTHAVHYNVVLWTMTFEFFGSFIVFLFCSIFGKSKNRGIFYLLFILVFWKTYYLSFILGLLLCDLFFNKNININIEKNKILKVVLFLIALFLGSYPNQIGKLEQSIDIKNTVYYILSRLEGADSFYHSIGAFLILYVLLNSSILKKIFSSKALVFLGNISFSMYLTHNIFIFYFSKNIFYYLLEAYQISYFLCFLISVGISLIPIFLFSVIFTKYIDRQSVIFSNYVYRKYFSSTEENNSIMSLNLKADLLKVYRKSSLFVTKNRKSIVISGALAILISLAAYMISPDKFRENNIRLDLNISAVKNVDLQIYYNTSEHPTFAEEQSVIETITSGTHRVSFKLPIPQTDALRLDLGVNPESIIVSDIVLSKGDIKKEINTTEIEKYERNQIDSITSGNNQLVITSTLSDPYIIMKVPFGKDLKDAIDVKKSLFYILGSFLIIFVILVIRKNYLKRL